MIVEYIRYQIPHNEASEFEAAYGAASTQLLAAPECLGYDIARCVDDPESYVVRIRWVSAEGHMAGFRKGPHFPAFFGLIRPFLRRIVEMRHYTPLEASGQA